MIGWTRNSRNALVKIVRAASSMKGAGEERAPDPMPSREERAFYSERRGAMRASRRRAATLPRTPRVRFASDNGARPEVLLPVHRAHLDFAHVGALQDLERDLVARVAALPQLLVELGLRLHGVVAHRQDDIARLQA